MVRKFSSAKFGCIIAVRRRWVELLEVVEEREKDDVSPLELHREQSGSGFVIYGGENCTEEVFFFFLVFGVVHQSRGAAREEVTMQNRSESRI